MRLPSIHFLVFNTGSVQSGTWCFVQYLTHEMTLVWPSKHQILPTIIIPFPYSESYFFSKDLIPTECMILFIGDLNVWSPRERKTNRRLFQTRTSSLDLNRSYVTFPAVGPVNFYVFEVFKNLLISYEPLSRMVISGHSQRGGFRLK